MDADQFSASTAISSDTAPSKAAFGSGGMKLILIFIAQYFLISLNIIGITFIIMI